MCSDKCMQTAAKSLIRTRRLILHVRYTTRRSHQKDKAKSIREMV